jgi:hypothetical protein
MVGVEALSAGLTIAGARPAVRSRCRHVVGHPYCRTVDVMTEADVLLCAARTAVRDHNWAEAVTAFAGAAAAVPLSGEDLEAMADAAYWASDLTEALDASHRAYAAYLDAERAGEAASAALLAARLHFVHGEMG